jgi:sugar phosphate isomerase/epimerase
MTKKFSIAHLTAMECPPPELTYIAGRTGYDYVSLRPIYMGLPGEPDYALAHNKKMFNETKKALQETGVKLLDIELARIHHDIDPKTYEPAFEAGAELGASHVLSSIWTDDRNAYMERFQEVCELADKYGLTVDLEFVPIASVRTLAGAVEVLETVNEKNAGLMIDAHHFHRSGDNPEDLKKLPREWFHYFHLCDAPGAEPESEEEMTRILREERLYLGEGGIDVKSMTDSIPEVPYSLELPNIKRAKELGYEEFARRCLLSAKEYFNEPSSDYAAAKR